MKATAKDLRVQTKEILEAVERGEEVVISYRGEERARLVPIRKKGNSVEDGDSPLFGLWRERKDMGDVAKHVRKLRKNRY